VYSVSYFCPILLKIYVSKNFKKSKTQNFTKIRRMGMIKITFAFCVRMPPKMPIDIVPGSIRWMEHFVTGWQQNGNNNKKIVRATWYTWVVLTKKHNTFCWHISCHVKSAQDILLYPRWEVVSCCNTRNHAHTFFYQQENNKQKSPDFESSQMNWSYYFTLKIGTDTVSETQYRIYYLFFITIIHSKTHLKLRKVKNIFVGRGTSYLKTFNCALST